MWITKKTDYATRAVLALALVHEWGPLKIHEIAERTCVPPSLLEQIMAQLRGAGIVRSVRGPQGGYRLNHPPAEITLARVVRLFAGPLAPIACATRSEPEPCPMEMGCSLLQTWREVRDATIAILERKTFADLARRDRRTVAATYRATSTPAWPRSALTHTGQIRSASTDDIAFWFIDTHYDGESFFVRHAYFTGADEPGVTG
jgi:Rrf2 family transcriptional regulator, cysteine metabolism repressor